MNGSKLYVGNFSYSISDLQLKDLFSKYGEVKETTIIAGKGFGFIEMSNPDEAQKAKEALNGTEWEGRTIRVDEARPMAPRNNKRNEFRPGGGFSRGGFGHSRRNSDNRNRQRRSFSR